MQYSLDRIFFERLAVLFGKYKNNLFKRQKKSATGL